MLEGKNEIMIALKSRGMLQEGKFKPAVTDLKNGENTMLDAKNMMMDGFKNITWN